MAEITSTHDLASQQEIDNIYRRRAEQLARPAADTVAATFGVLIFRLGAERYGMELSALVEVFPYRGCTPVAGTQPALLGVMNVRGDIRPVADLRRLLELPPNGDAAAGFVAMVRPQDRPVGFRIDTIDEVRHVDPAQLVGPGSGPAPIGAARFVKAITADTVLLIDIQAALAALGLESRETDARGM